MVVTFSSADVKRTPAGELAVGEFDLLRIGRAHRTAAHGGQTLSARSGGAPAAQRIRSPRPGGAVVPEFATLRASPSPSPRWRPSGCAGANTDVRTPGVSRTTTRRNHAESTPVPSIAKNEDRWSCPAHRTGDRVVAGHGGGGHGDTSGG